MKKIYILLSFFIFPSQIHKLQCQILNHHLGEIIVQLRVNQDISSMIGASTSIKNRPIELLYKRNLSPQWNIHLMYFDYNLYNEYEVLHELRHNPKVHLAQFNHILYPRKKPNDPYYKDQWYLHNITNADIDIDAEQAWEITTTAITDLGDTIVTCVIDGGIDTTHSDIKSALWHNVNEIPYNSIDDDNNGYIDDRIGWNTFDKNCIFEADVHGTAIAGLAAAQGNNNIGIASPNWDSKLMFVAGGADEANAIESYTYPYTMRRLYNLSNGHRGAFVVTVSSSWGRSFGRPQDAPIWCAIYDSLGKIGILSVAATANSAIDVDIDGDLPTSCTSNYLITVTNVNQSNDKVDAAAYGLKSIDLGAYGQNVISTLTTTDEYALFSGTSFAAPQVAAAVSFLYSIPCSKLSSLSRTNPDIAALEVKKILLQGTTKNNSLEFITSSQGVLNLYQSAIKVSPLHFIKFNPRSVLCDFISEDLKFPIVIQYKKQNDSIWIEKTILEDTIFEITNLEDCTEYELKYKGACPRYSQMFSPIINFKTTNCCDKITDIIIESQTKNQVKLSFINNSNTDSLWCLIREPIMNTWDTFLYLHAERNITINHLIPCNNYELMMINKCNNTNERPISDIIQIKNTECQQCSDTKYCRRKTMQSNLEWIDKIKLNNIIHQSGNNKGYGNFIGTNHSWSLSRTAAYDLELTVGYAATQSIMNMAAYIDYNQNGEFDSNEIITTNADTFTKNKTYNFTIPKDAILGLTRMRVICKYAEFNRNVATACGTNLEFGEYEDYCVHIIEENCKLPLLCNITNINNTSCEINNPNAITIAYRVHKKQEPNWSPFDTIKNQLTFAINNLEECNVYEVELKQTCKDRLASSYLSFTTKGKNCATDINYLKQNEIFIYPNPIQDFVIIDSKSKIINLHITDINGKIIYKKSAKDSNNKLHISTQEWQHGIYFMKIINASDEKLVKKIIKL